MSWNEILTGIVATLSLLFSVGNARKLREHDQVMKVSEAHLRVTSEIKLRLHQHSWDLLREIHAAATSVFEALRTYQVAALHGAHIGGNKMPGADYHAALEAVQRFSGLAHVAPPDRQLLRDAASGFTKAFNLVNANVVSKTRPSPEQELNAFMAVLQKALGDSALGTREWNEALWQDQTVSALAPVARKS